MKSECQQDAKATCWHLECQTTNSDATGSIMYSPFCHLTNYMYSNLPFSLSVLLTSQFCANTWCWHKKFKNISANCIFIFACFAFCFNYFGTEGSAICSIHPFVSIISFEPTDLWPWPSTRVQVITIVRLGLTVKTIMRPVGPQMRIVLIVP